MSSNPYNPPESDFNEEGSQKIRPILRWCILVSVIFIVPPMIIFAEVGRVIGKHYHNIPGWDVIAFEVALCSIGVYLLIVAIFGRWRLLPRAGE